MSLSSETNRVDNTGNGAVDTYSYTFRILNQADLLVTVRDTDGDETTLTITTHYTVSGVGAAAGGSVALVNGAFDWLDGDGDLKSNYKLTIRRVVDIVQETDIRNQGDFHAETHEDAFDYLTMIDQQQQDLLDRSVKLPETISSAVFDPTLPSDLTDNPGSVVIVNDDGDAFETGPTADEISSAQSYAEAASDSADDAEDSATLASEWASKTDGQVAATDYSAKAWAVGGTGVTDTASRGAAKEWAIETSSSVDTSEYSAKEYAQGTQAGTGGSAKDWAQKTSAVVTGSSYSAKEWATGTQTRGAASGGSAKDWANYTSGTVDNSEYSAKKYATDAAASAASAASTLASALWRGVVRVSTTPYTVLAANNGYLHVIDSTAGAITVNLPALSGLTLPVNFGFKLDAGANAVTLDANGTDTIDGSGTYSLAVTEQGVELIATTDGSPDDWETVAFGAAGGNMVVDLFSGDGSDTTFDLSVTPSSENNTQVFVDGVYQQKNTYSISGTTLTFSAAPPSGTGNIEVVTGTTLSIGVPADGTVTRAKLTTGAVGKKSTETHTTTASAAATTDLVFGNTTGGTFTTTLPSAAIVGAGYVMEFVKTSSDFTAWTLDGSGSETIGGSATTALHTIGEYLRIISDGTNWIIVARDTDTAPASYTPTFTGWGTVASINFLWCRVGSMIRIFGKATWGTRTGVEARVSLPTGLTVSSVLTSNTRVGQFTPTTSTTTIYHVLATSGNAYVTFASTATSQLTNQNGDALSFDSVATSHFYEIPITGWNA